MARKHSLAAQIGRDAYLVSRTAEDVDAVQHGGAPRLARRVVRRKATRSSPILGALLRLLSR